MESPDSRTRVDHAGEGPRFLEAIRLCALTWSIAAGGLAAAQDVGTIPASLSPSSIPSLKGIFPPGLTSGGETDCVLTGRNLSHVARCLVSGGGIEVVDLRADGEGSLKVRLRVEKGAGHGYRELRVDGPDGVSNVLPLRVDPLPQVVEAEPNDDLEKANALAIGKVAAGTIRPGDLDTFRFSARAGRKVTVEVEARRLGTAIAPVATLLGSSGVALAEGRETSGCRGDCRFAFTVPEDGEYLVQVRDNLYQGADHAHYRLRIHDEPFATGMFPLGGPRGGAIVVTASGGSLEAPRSREVVLPDRAGALVDVSPFEGPGGAVVAPQRLVTGEGPEVAEGARDPRNGAGPIRLAVGQTANGRIDAPGERDHFAVRVEKGERIRIKVVAAVLGSWLDSVITLRDERGVVLAEDDDPADPAAALENVGAWGAALPATDSVLEYQAPDSGDLDVEIADRYGSGGPEYAYRLTVGPDRPDVAVVLRLGPAEGESPPVLTGVGPGLTPFLSAASAVNLRPGASVAIVVLARTVGRPGPIVVRALGLPPGVAADPVTLRPSGPPRGMGQAVRPPSTGRLVLRAGPRAEPALATFRVEATWSSGAGEALTTTASAIVVVGSLPSALPNRPVLQALDRVPIKILEAPRR